LAKLGTLAVAITASTKQFLRAMGTVRKSVTGLGKSVVSIPGLAAGAGVTIAAKKLLEVGDAYVNLDAQLTDLTGSALSASFAQKELFRMSQRTGTSVLENSKAFAKLQMSSDRTGLTMNENITVLEGLNKIFALSGANALDASIAMRQLGQSLASGNLAGDEFRSIAEAAPGLLKALAAELRVPTGELKKMGSEGKLTSDILGKAFLNIASGGAAAFKEIPVTSERAFQRIINSMQKVWDAVLDNTGLIKTISDAFDSVAVWIESNQYRFVEWGVQLKLWIEENIPVIVGKVRAGFNSMLESAKLWWPVIKDVFTRSIEIMKTVLPWIQKIVESLKVAIDWWAKYYAKGPKAGTSSDSFGMWDPPATNGKNGGGAGGGTIVNNISQKFSRTDLAVLNTNQQRQRSRS
jgi:tape measure domain-containing protein